MYLNFIKGLIIYTHQYIIVMESMIGKIILIVVIAVNIGTLSLFTFVPAESFSLIKIGSPDTEQVIGPPELTFISSSDTGVPGPPGPNNDRVPGPPGPNNASKALISIYNTIIIQQQDHIQFLLDQQKTLRDLLINSSSSYGDIR
jgi:hypothetical protein